MSVTRGDHWRRVLELLRIKRFVCACCLGSPDAQLNPKKKIWEAVAPDLKVDGEGRAIYKGEQLVITSASGAQLGPPVADTLRNVNVK